MEPQKDQYPSKCYGTEPEIDIKDPTPPSPTHRAQSLHVSSLVVQSSITASSATHATMFTGDLFSPDDPFSGAAS